MLNRSQVFYLSYITTESNLPSIFENGLLSHNRAREVAHESVADPEVQARRAGKMCNGRLLHDYANLYFWPRNAMMYRVRANQQLCVVRVSCRVLDLPGVHYSCRNAAVQNATFHAVSESAFPPLERDRVYSRSWMEQDGTRDEDAKEIMQAEVLVPDMIEPQYLEKVYVRSQEQFERVRHLISLPDIAVHGKIFFD